MYNPHGHQWAIRVEYINLAVLITPYDTFPQTAVDQQVLAYDYDARRTRMIAAMS